MKEVRRESDNTKIKVEPALFYRACDELGLLVIQDMPALRPLQTKKAPNCTDIDIIPDADQQVEFSRQLELLVHQLRSYPSISTWVSESLYLANSALTISRSFTTRDGAK